MTAFLFGSFLLLLVIGVPVAIALAASSLLYVALQDQLRNQEKTLAELNGFLDGLGYLR